jgi:hypothetical protein
MHDIDEKLSAFRDTMAAARNRVREWRLSDNGFPYWDIWRGEMPTREAALAE